MSEAKRQLAAIMPARRNPEWDEGGFTDLSTEVPLGTQVPRLLVLELFKVTNNV